MLRALLGLRPAVHDEEGLMMTPCCEGCAQTGAGGLDSSEESCTPTPAAEDVRLLCASPTRPAALPSGAVNLLLKMHILISFHSLLSHILQF